MGIKIGTFRIIHYPSKYLGEDVDKYLVERLRSPGVWDVLAECRSEREANRILSRIDKGGKNESV